MKLPARIIDLSSPLENETVYDPPFMRPKIEYHGNAETAPLLCELFPGLRPQDLPDGEGWAIEQVQLTTHNGAWMDAPIHFQSHTIDGQPSPSQPTKYPLLVAAVLRRIGTQIGSDRNAVEGAGHADVEIADLGADPEADRPRPGAGGQALRMAGPGMRGQG